MIWWEKYGNTPDGNIAFIAKARNEGLRDFGNAMSPFNAFLLLQGLETLSLRMERHCSNAQNIAEWLQKLDWVEEVNYPGLKGNKFNKLGEKYFKKGYGGILQFKINAPLEKVDKFVDNLKLISHLANIGDAKTLIIHPSTTTHHQLSEEEQRNCGVIPGTLRLSVGIEHIDDIKEDIIQAWEKVK
jgi:O-acetylhomoserine (thiol)-lyase